MPLYSLICAEGWIAVLLRLIVAMRLRLSACAYQVSLIFVDARGVVGVEVRLQRILSCDAAARCGIDGGLALGRGRGRHLDGRKGRAIEVERVEVWRNEASSCRKMVRYLSQPKSITSEEFARPANAA